MNLEIFFKISYGLYVVSSRVDNILNGYISNTVFQVTSDPPQFAVACNKNNYTAEIISQGKAFAISILKQDYNPDIMGTFGYHSGRDTDKFGSFAFRINKTGVPILVEDVVAWLECEVVSTFDLGTHLLFVGTLLDAEMLDETAVPLTYRYYHEVKKGRAPKNSPTYIDPVKLRKPK
jgi:flavin reductase (DIM6/NTAB) family NADH-FMN oxidoreductase RutF